MTIETSSRISLDEFSRLAHISKRKAKWLLMHGYVPYVDTGKKTHRFMIAMDDANRFLCSKGPRYPIGVFSSKLTTAQPINRISQIRCSDFKKYLALRWSYIPDILRVKECAELLGYTCPTIRYWLHDGKMRYLTTHKGFLIPKISLISFTASYILAPYSRLSPALGKLVSLYLKENAP